VLVVSRIDTSTGGELVTAFNNGDSAARVTVSTGTPGSTWSLAYGSGTAVAGSSTSVTLTIPPVSAVVARPSAAIPAGKPPVPTLKAGPDSISSYYALSAGVAGGRPVTVAFALRAPGGGWRRLAVDDSAPYRALLDPRRYRKGSRLEAVAIARGFDGSTSVSRVLAVKPNP
jgi:hypothetical protein